VLQAFARQIEPADGGVFIDVAQDVRQLQGAAKMMAARFFTALEAEAKPSTD